MPLTGRYRAVIFDMDGLLLDTEGLWDRAEGELFRRHGDTWTFEDKLAVMGTSFETSARYYADRLGEPVVRGPALVEEMRTLMRAELERRVDAHPGAVELVRRLRELSGVQVGLASNSSRDLVDVALRRAGLEGAFDAIVTADDVTHAKPAPDIYLRACELLRVSPSEALALEDTAPGIAAAKAAGLTCIAVPQFAETDVRLADRVVSSLEELLA
ncbi:MAG: HAD family phosphatase [Chloroflexota bacterium]